MYQPGGTVRDVLEAIQSHAYVLPAIQRKFVWKPEQIARLFDSMMQGYPFGTFLLWRVNADNSHKYKFYDFVCKYHQRDSPHCPELPIFQNKQLTAVLDGQQRITALNIGLRGSMANKLPNKWRSNPDAFPTTYLYLNLLSTPEEDEEGERYSFAFLTKERASKSTDDECWFRVRSRRWRLMGTSWPLAWMGRFYLRSTSSLACSGYPSEPCGGCKVLDFSPGRFDLRGTFDGDGRKSKRG